MKMFNDVSKEDIEKMDEIINQLKNKIIPEKYPDSVEYIGFNVPGNIRYSYDYPFCRESFCQRFGFSLVSLDWVRILANEIIKGEKCLEIMCGSGMLSKALKTCGVDIMPTDSNSWAKRADENPEIFKPNAWLKEPFTEIEEIDAIEAIKKYGENVGFVIVSWPYMDNVCYNALQTMRNVNPKCKMIYIGEGYGGCCASDMFFDTFDELYDIEHVGYEEYSKLPISRINKIYKQWAGIHDIVMIGS